MRKVLIAMFRLSALEVLQEGREVDLRFPKHKVIHPLHLLPTTGRIGPTRHQGSACLPAQGDHLFE